MVDFVSADLYLRVLLALAGIIAAIAIAAFVAKRLGFAGKFAASSHNRLGLVEAVAVDAKRRLVLLRRDNVEHLVLIGPEGSTVVETGIRGTLAVPEEI